MSIRYAGERYARFIVIFLKDFFSDHCKFGNVFVVNLSDEEVLV